MNANFSLSEIIVLLLVSYTAYVVAEHGKGPRITCPNPIHNPRCTCDAYTLSCPFVGVILNATEVQVRCTDALGDIPNLQIGNIETLSVENCKPSTGKSVLDTLKFLGLNSTKELRYKNWISEIPYKAILFEGLQDIEFLSLDVLFIQVDLGIFNHLSHLRELVIKDDKPDFQQTVSGIKVDGFFSFVAKQKVGKFSSGILRNQQNLRKLNLKLYKLIDLNKSCFQDVQNLEYLDLSSNQITEISTDTFSLLANLSELDLSFNSLSNIPGNLTVNRKLKTFKLMSNSLDLNLSDHFLSYLPELRTVHIKNNQYIELPETLLRESKAIVELDMSGNLLENVPEFFLQDQCNLEYLNFDGNNLRKLPEQFLTATRKLKVLGLSNNRLESLGTEFATLGELKVLRLNNNKLLFIQYDTFQGTTSLERLYMQHNSLHDIPVWNYQNSGLFSSESFFTSFEFRNMPLKMLNLSHNHISHLSDIDFKFFSTKINVDLSHNYISHVKAGNLDQDMSHVMVNLTNNPLNCNCHLLDFVQYVTAKKKSHIKFLTDNLYCNEPEKLFSNPIDQLHYQELICPLTTKDSMGCPPECSCIYRSVDSTIVVNCTGRRLTEIQSLPQPSSVNFNFIELHIENNFFKELPTLNLTSYEIVRELHARNNSIATFSVHNLPPHLRLLDLAHNNLTTMNTTILETFNKTESLESVYLSNNHWICDCTAQDFMRFVQHNRLKLSADKSPIKCKDGSIIDSINVDELCGDSIGLILLICSTIVSFGLLIGLLFALYYCYEIEIKVWLFTHNLLLWLVTEEELDKDKEYDAFISYCHNDAQFIEDILVPRMENEMNFKTCVHERDWIPGETIPEQIISSVENSRRTIIVLSKHYLESTWAQMEFQTAHLKSLAEKRIRVIIVIVGEIGEVDSLGPELKAYLKMNTYVKHEDPWFWDKLRYAMPHPITVKELKKRNKKRSQKETPF